MHPKRIALIIGGPRRLSYCDWNEGGYFLFFIYEQKFFFFTFSLLFVILNSKNKHKNFLQSPATARKISML